MDINTYAGISLRRPAFMFSVSGRGRLLYQRGSISYLTKRYQCIPYLHKHIRKITLHGRWYARILYRVSMQSTAFLRCTWCQVYDYQKSLRYSDRMLGYHQATINETLDTADDASIVNKPCHAELHQLTRDRHHHYHHHYHHHHHPPSSRNPHISLSV